jgi:hypothetical protein
MHPLDKILEWLPEIDFGVLDHRFSRHGRDCQILVEDEIGSDPGQHVITFTHCVEMVYETRVADNVWPRSWTDVFIDYKCWQEAGEPEGYAWGTIWSLAYPGLKATTNSPVAKTWERRLGKPMYEATLETDRFFMRLIFHDVRTAKLSDDTSTVSNVLHFPVKTDELNERLKKEYGVELRDGENIIRQEDYTSEEWNKILNLFRKHCGWDSLRDND